MSKSESRDVHLSVLRKLPEVIRESIDAEQHPDYKKGQDGARRKENGIGSDLIVHKLYGAVEIDGKVYRVKTTVYEYADKNEPKTPHSYEATKTELLAGTLADGETATYPRTNSSVSVANLLKGVEKSYEPGEFCWTGTPGNRRKTSVSVRRGNPVRPRAVRRKSGRRGDWACGWPASGWNAWRTEGIGSRKRF